MTSALTLAATVRRNTVLLSLTMALNWSVIVLMASLTTLTIGSLFGLPELAGLGFAMAAVAIGVGSIVTGRVMDRVGRRNALMAAFVVGAIGALLVYFGVRAVSLPLALAGLLALSAGGGGANLARVAGADMYPPARRPRGIAFVLIGAAFGAVGAPIVFGPLLAAARGFGAEALAAPWPVAAGILLAGAAVLLLIRTDPREIAERLRAAAEPTGSAAPAARPLAELLRLPMVPLALLAALLAQGVMTSVMAMAGLVLHQHGHDLGAVTLTVSIHFVGMFGLVLVVGRLVEAIGRFRSVLVGLLVLAGGVLLLLPGGQLLNFVPGMFAVGVGWNIAYVAATAILADAARPAERGRLLGASDMLSVLSAAGLSIGAGLILEALGLPGLVAGGALLALVPAALIALNRGRLEGIVSAGARPG